MTYADESTTACACACAPEPSLCGEHLALTRTRPNSRISYTCTREAGHNGSHHDSVAAIAWAQR